jgi:F-type H+-transporting ATPase subunit gamma
MSLGLNKTKRRIQAVKGTEKITKSMELIATVKLKKYKDAVEKTSLYTQEYAQLMGELFAHDSETGSHYGKPNAEAKNSLFIVISSDLGLCGSYNNEIFKFVKKVALPEDVIAPIGNKAVRHYSHDPVYRNISHDFENVNMAALDLTDIHRLCVSLKDQFNAKKYQRIYLVFTHYVNSITFAPTRFQILPVQIQQEKWMDEEYCPPLFDEAPRVLIHRFMDDYLSAVFYGRLVESQLSEQASRRTAMDNANDNADRILDRLTVEYNKARQNAITQEITEVVSGASADNS